MKEINILGNTTYKAIGYCHCEVHKGALTRELAKKHKCCIKHCKYLEKYPNTSWDKKVYVNRPKI